MLQFTDIELHRYNDCLQLYNFIKDVREFNVSFSIHSNCVILHLYLCSFVFVLAHCTLFVPFRIIVLL